MIRDELGLWLKLGIGPVAVFAILRRGLVEQHLLAFHIAEEFVAAGTADVFVRAGQGKLGALVMIEKRWPPLGSVVAIGAWGNAFGPHKLTAMNVGMAFLAFRRGLREVHVDELCFQVRRPVAVDASHGPMGAEQRELGPVVIEACEVFPALGGMAGLAAGRSVVAAERFHAPGELAAVRILVASGAGQILEVIDRGGFVAARFASGLSLRGDGGGQQRRAGEG